MSGFARFIIILTTVSAAIMELIDTSIVNVALSQISGNLGATIEDASWVITAYAIANVIIIPMTGFLARYFGRKNYYVSSIVLFTFASVMCGNSTSLWELVFWRFIQGIGGGALLSTSQGILFDAFPPNQRGIASGLFGMGIVLGPTIGPTLGGLIVDNYHWSWIFDINIPFGILATALAIRFIDKKPEEFNINRSAISIDYLGVILLTVGVGSLQYVLEKGQSDDWFADFWIRTFSVSAFLGIIAFIWHELATEHPIINLRVLKNSNLIASNVLTFVCGFGLFGSVFVFPVVVQRIMGYSPTDAGLAIVPGALMGLVMMPFIGKRLQAGTSPIYFVVIGFIAFMLHGYLSSLANLDAGKNWFIVPQIFRGMGTACLTVPLINQAVVGLAPKDMASGIALTNMLRQLGGAFGIAVMNTYVSRRFAIHRTDLVSNLQPNDPETLERLNNYMQGAIARGYNALEAKQMSFGILEGAITKQSFLLSYMDAFFLITLFFICASPFILMLRVKKLDKVTQAKVAEEAH